jgi:hypothetical protein
VYGGNFQQPLMLDSGDAEGSSTALDAHWRVINALVERNVLVGNPTGIVIGHNYSLAPSGCTIRDNVVAQAANGVAVFQKIAPVSTTLTNNAYAATPPAAGLAQDSTAIWRRAGVGPRLTYLQPADVGIGGDPNDTDGTGTLVSGGGTTPPTVDDGTAAAKFGWGSPLRCPTSSSTPGPRTRRSGASTTGPATTATASAPGPGHRDRRQDGAHRPGPTATPRASSTRFDQQYGRWEVRCRSFVNATSNGNDYHPVLIIWPTSGNWPEDGEYDFLENGTPGAQTAESYIHYPHPANVSVQQEHFTKSGWTCPSSTTSRSSGPRTGSPPGSTESSGSRCPAVADRTAAPTSRTCRRGT